MYEELFGMISSCDEQSATAIVRCIREGQSPMAVVSYIKTRDASSPTRRDPALLSSQRRAENFLVSLAHSTASLKDVVRLAMSGTSLANRDEVASPREADALRNRIVHLWHLEAMIQRPPLLQDALSRWRDGGSIPTAGIQSDHVDLIEPRRTAGSGNNTTLTALSGNKPWLAAGSHSFHVDHARPPDDGPIHLVAAEPWTSITLSDEAVSHLVSLFLTWINPSWRFVEEDLFLKGIAISSRHRSVRQHFTVPDIRQECDRNSWTHNFAHRSWSTVY